ncbi:MAG: tRNA (adenosine(37)-N6)-dimethylallyltransferase MiaA [Actinomycetota bacterium]
MAVVGPTASGKSDLAERIADALNAEILSVDSMQVFRGMDIGTAKPDEETRWRFGYHLVDVADPSEDYTVAQFQRAGVEVLDRAEKAGTTIVVAGGSGLHFRSLMDPLEFPPTDDELRSDLEALSSDDLKRQLLSADPDAGTVVDLANPRRVLRAVEIWSLTGDTPTERAATKQADAVRSYKPVRPFVAVGLDPGEDLSDRIEERFDQMLTAGLLDEVNRLAARMGRTARQAVGYRELLRVVEEGSPLAEARAATIAATTALAKRQRTFFRRDPRIRWIPWHHDAEALATTALEGFEGSR